MMRDGLGRGIVFGLLFAAPLWAAIALVGWLLGRVI